MKLNCYKEQWQMGGVAERSKAADCKSADICLRRFESYPHHHEWHELCAGVA